MKYVLGIGGYVHDASAALIADGMLLSAVQEERLSRVKHQGGFPYQSIQYCLKAAEITINDLECVSFYQSKYHYLKLIIPVLKDLFAHPLWAARNPVKIIKRIGFILSKQIKFISDFEIFLVRLDIPRKKVQFNDHHMSHAASLYYSSGLEHMSILVSDAVGDGKTTSFWHGNHGKLIEIAAPVMTPHSLAKFYSLLTKYLGFNSLGDQYKVMGLASYGKPVYFDEFLDFFVLADNNHYKFNPKYVDWRKNYELTSFFYEKYGPQRKRNEKISRHHEDIAASTQAVFEYYQGEYLTHLINVTGDFSVGIVGGTALNCTANGKFLSSKKYRDVIVSAFSSDVGTSIGAAYLGSKKINPSVVFEAVRTDALGPGYSNSEIREVLSRSGLPLESVENPPEVAAQLIADGNIIGWFNGRSEFGPRALGNRSILADPRSAKVKDRINSSIKFREEFRPFAPIVLKEFARDYFEIDTEAPFMTYTCNVVDSMKKTIAGVVHVDGTSRVQTVNKLDNAEIYSLISFFYDLTGVPVILNTSFNLAGEAMVCSPEDAIRTFYTSGIDHLILGNYILSK